MLKYEFKEKENCRFERVIRFFVFWLEGFVGSYDLCRLGRSLCRCRMGVLIRLLWYFSLEKLKEGSGSCFSLGWFGFREVNYIFFF